MMAKSALKGHSVTQTRLTIGHLSREILHGVGADGVKVKLPILQEIAVVSPCPLGE